MALILIIDDEIAVIEALRAMIESEGHEVLTAANGRDGLAVMSVQPPDLVFTDTIMLVMGGPAMAAAMQTDPALARVPLVAMSSITEEIVGPGYTRYSAFLTKPFRLAEVTGLLSRLLS